MSLTDAQVKLARAMPEKGYGGLQDNVRDMALRFGWLFFHDRDSRQNAAGLPDCVMVHPVRGRFLVAELKKIGGQLSECQIQWLAGLALAGVDVRVWTPTDWYDGTIQGELE